ncbi:diguanylate cyclase [Arcobacter sp. s6]|uniref:diguanylate cyclase domain-containing protein n=1 Tax=Arcobacter sp. s6 TaxID=3230363 RepID=UPI0034A07C27
MFKNPLFLKIIMIFTLPALGILYFSTILVFDKIKLLDEIYKTNYNLEYLKISEKLIHSLQKERGLSVMYDGKEEKITLDLEKQKEVTNFEFNKYLKYTDVYLLELNEQKEILITIKELQKKFRLLDDIRLEIENNTMNKMDIITKFSDINNLLLDSILSIKSVKAAFNFNEEFLNVYYFLVYKEALGVERALISFILSEGKIDSKIKNELIKIQLIQTESFNFFIKNTSVEFFNKYNEIIPKELTSKIDKIKINLEKNQLSNLISLEQWWQISTQRIEHLDELFNIIIGNLEETSKNIQKKAFIDQNLSLFFLFICFITLISLLFVLKNIIFKQQISFDKLEKQKKVYELLNNTNKYLLKNNTKENLYSKIHQIISKHPSMVFSFIYDIENKDEKDNIVRKGEIYAQEGVLKDLLLMRLEESRESNSDNLLNKVISTKKNVIIESFENNNISVFFKYSKQFNIKSAAAFPIKKFDEVASVFVIYSNENKFFDYEGEVLFNKLVNDLSHILEKFDYEKNRLDQEKELKITSFAFESSEPMIITDELGKIIKVNHAFCDVMKYERKDIIGKNPRIFKSSHQDKNFADQLWNDLRDKGYWSGEVYNKKANGQILPLRTTITAIKNKDNVITHYLGQYIDIGEQKDKEKVLEYQATHDNLTGLPNRLLLLDRIEHAITKVVRHQIVGGLIFIDLDNFKEVNDTLGHDIGDTLLVIVSKTIKDVIRDEDTLARIGGDEFIILVDNIGNNKENAKINILNLAEKIKDSLNAITHIEGHINVSTPSIGITLFSDSSVSVKNIIKQADTAMYAAKKQGKNAIEFF